MTMQRNQNLRNIAIIAHVDHGKTTLVDQLFQQSGLFRQNQEVEDRMMDNMDLERERGITIAAKNCSVIYNDIKINIVDTPGHADFGGEVERSLKMVDGAILLVDASEGPLPQTRFVLEKALKQNLKIIVCVNKIDRQDARPQEVLDEVYDLFIDLGATDQQIDFPVIYAIGRDGIAQNSLEEKSDTLKPLFDKIINFFEGPQYDDAEPFQMLVCNIGYSDYTGRLAIGKVFNGKTFKNDSLVCMAEDDSIKNTRVTKLQTYDGVHMKDVESVDEGEIIILSGVDDVKIGDTICHKDSPKALERVHVDEPTVAMRFIGNNSPFSGQDGKYTQTQRVLERLRKEELYNVAIKVEEDPESETLIVKGRGEFQMAVLIETMRREGFELCVGRPEILFKEENGKTLEPIERVVIDCDSDFTGAVTEKLSTRKGQMINLNQQDNSRVRLEFEIPSRGLIGYRNEFLTDTKGTGLINTYLKGFEEYKGEIPSRESGSLVADRQGSSVAFALYNLEDRGRLFIKPNVMVYEGMIVGEYNKTGDLNVNVLKGKKLTNMRAAGKDDAISLTPVQPMTLEKAIEFIKDDEMVEVTPLHIRLRKTVLDATQRMIAAKRNKKKA